MAKKKRKFHSTLPALVKEAGVQQRWKRGELRLEEVKDPDQPQRKIIRLRRRNSFDELLNRGIITPEQYEFADRYVILCEKASGTTKDLYAVMNLIKVSSHSWEPSPSQHQAYNHLFKIWQGLGRYHTSIIHQVVLNNQSLSQMALKLDCNRHIAGGHVISAFIRLQEVMEDM